MAFGIEIRVPMLDHIFLDFVCSFKPEDLLNGQTKHLLRTSMRGIVPDQVLDQKKKFGFAAPLNDYIFFNTDNTFRFYSQQVNGVPFINQKNAFALAHKALKEKDEKSLMYFWRILSVSVWYKTFFND
jgi:asparagine synthase (glutamine-hydrolysing)